MGGCHAGDGSRVGGPASAEKRLLTRCRKSGWHLMRGQDKWMFEVGEPHIGTEICAPAAMILSVPLNPSSICPSGPTLPAPMPARLSKSSSAKEHSAEICHPQFQCDFTL